jgi:hypothetical protein
VVSGEQDRLRQLPLCPPGLRQTVGQFQPVTAPQGLFWPARTRVIAGQGLCGEYGVVLVAHGKEKVYGSIP